MADLSEAPPTANTSQVQSMLHLEHLLCQECNFYGCTRRENVQLVRFLDLLQIVTFQKCPFIRKIFEYTGVLDEFLLSRNVNFTV